MVHPSVQAIYIAFSIIPAILAAVFCTYTMTHSGETVLRGAKEVPLVPIYNMRKTVQNLERDGYGGETALQIEELKGELEDLKFSLENSYQDTMKQWNVIRLQIFMVMFWCVILIGCLALVFSHRIVGPLYRLQKCIDQFVLGQDTGPIRLRKKDHYKTLAWSVEKLRKSLVGKGVLQNTNTG